MVRSPAWLDLLRRALPVVAVGNPKSDLSELRDPKLAYILTRWINRNLYSFAPHRFDYGVGGITGYIANWMYRVNNWGGEIHIFITNKGGVLDEKTLKALERCYPWWGSYFEGTCLAMRSLYTEVVSDDVVDLGWVFKHANKLIMDLNNVLNYYVRGEITVKIDGQEIELPKAQMMALTEYIVDCRTHIPTPIKPIAVYIPRLLVRYHVKGRILKDRDISNILSGEIGDIEYLPSWADIADDPRLRSSPDLKWALRRAFPVIPDMIKEPIYYEKIKKIACALVDSALRHGEDIETAINVIQRHIPEEIYIVVDDKEYYVKPDGEPPNIKQLGDSIKYLEPMANNYYREMLRVVSTNLLEGFRGGGGQEERGLEADPELEEILMRKAQSMAKGMVDKEGQEEDVDEEYLEELRRRSRESRRRRRAEDEWGEYDVYGDPHSILDT